ncbi:MAG TPA: glycerol kinase, partial [Gemmatimonadales bacterium]|nr:glycerol kinase [Gemmatimonadales bacterium]
PVGSRSAVRARTPGSLIRYAMASILALDQGTTGSTALIVHQDGTLLGRGYRELAQHFPRPGWVEHDPRDIFEVTLAAARDALAAAGERPVGIGITNQRETAVLWDRATLEPATHAIVWQDRRTSDRCLALRQAGFAPLIAERTGLVPDPYFSATKLEWLLADPRIRARAVRGELAAGTVDSWVIARLTGGTAFVTDHTNASRTMLYGLERRDWDPELLALFGVPDGLLPTVVASSGIVGESTAAHLGVSLPIAGIAGDQQAALFGQGCCAPGTAKNTYGTGTFLLVQAGDRRPRPAAGLLSTAACGPRGEPTFAVEGSVFIAGAAIQWLRDGLGLIAAAAESEGLARSVSDTAGVHFVPAFVGLGSPHWEPEARGTITGITRGTTRAHLVRAGLEAIAFSSAELLDAMTGDGVTVPALRVDGGATANDWLMQFQADILGLPVERPEMVETTALGAAGLAGIALGIWRSPDDFLAGRRFSRFEPAMPPEERSRRRAEWDRSVRAALAWATTRSATG